MTKNELNAALSCVYLAINNKIYGDNKTESAEDLAKQFGKYTTNKEHLEAVWDCIDYDKLMGLLGDYDQFDVLANQIERELKQCLYEHNYDFDIKAKLIVIGISTPNILYRFNIGEGSMALACYNSLKDESKCLATLNTNFDNFKSLMELVKE